MWAQQQEAAAYGSYVSKADLQQFLQHITLTEGGRRPLQVQPARPETANRLRDDDEDDDDDYTG